MYSTPEIRVTPTAVPVAEEDMQEGVGPTIGDFAFYRMHFQQQNRCGRKEHRNSREKLCALQGQSFTTADHRSFQLISAAGWPLIHIGASGSRARSIWSLAQWTALCIATRLGNAENTRCHHCHHCFSTTLSLNKGHPQPGRKDNLKRTKD